MIDIAGLLDLADSGADPTQIKAQLPIPYVLEQSGVLGELGEDGKFHTRCPFHDDSDPSFDVFGEHLDRWGCYPCGAGGDVFDLIQRLGQASHFAEALRVAEGLLRQMTAEGWTGPSKPIAKVFDLKAAADRVAAAALADVDAVAAFVSQKGYPFDVAFLKEQFGVGAEGGYILVPHWDRQAQLIGLKRRTAHTKAISVPGAKFTDFYGAWRDTGKRPVLLCEGESDVWAAAAALEDYDVLGLPTGAGTRPEKLAALLAKRQVTLAFDGDDAGRKATRLWHKALLDQGCRVLVVPMPDNLDLAGVPDPAEVVGRARAVPPFPEDAPLGIGGGYGRKGGKDGGHTMLSNWTFRPERELVGDDGATAYEGRMEPAGIPVVLSSHDLASKGALVKWSNSHGGAWYGSDRDAQLLLAIFQAVGPFLKTGRMTATAGLHDWHFVVPGRRVGPDYWQYVPPAGDVEIAKSVFLDPGPWSAEQVHILRSLHTTAVMDPILAWLAAAPLRSMFRSFPFLGVTGSSGTGKTTLLELVLRSFSGSNLTTNLTSTTRYAVSAMAEATNGVPVWFDEYRPGARSDTLVAVNQILRDAFDGAASARGGTKDHWAKVSRRASTAPLIVSGEDSFDETSIVQRMVSVAMPLEGKNPEVLGRVKAWPANGLPLAYIEWLVGSYQLDRLPRPANYEAGPEGLPARNRTGVGVLDFGWKLLSRFVDEGGGRDLGAPDWSLVCAEAAEAAKHSPIEDALRWCVDEPDAAGAVIGIRGDDVWVRCQNFVQFVTKAGFTLPGGSSAIRKYLQQHYKAKDSTIEVFGGQKRALLLPGGRGILGL